MPGKWAKLQLGDVCQKIGSGATPRGGSSVYLDRGEVALIRSQNVYNDGFSHGGLVYLTEKHAAELANVEVVAGDVLLNITGDSVARVCQVHPNVLPARVNQHVAIVRPDAKRLSPQYLRYYLISREAQAELLSLAGSGATRSALTKGMIEAFRISAPVAIAEQQAIASILGSLDDKIELNRRRNRTLEAMARAIFQSWFVDFDPVRAKLDGRRPTGMDEATAKLFPDTFTDSPLGPIPAGWDVRPIAAIAEINYGKNLPATKLLDRGYPVYGAAGLIGYFSEPMFQTPVLLITSRGSGSGTVHETLGPAFVTNNSFSVVPRDAWFSRHFLRSWLRTADILARVTGSAQPQLTITNLQTLDVMTPPRSVLEAYHVIVDTLWERARLNGSESLILSALRDTLLPKLISGELRVPDAERIVGEVA